MAILIMLSEHALQHSNWRGKEARKRGVMDNKFLDATALTVAIIGALNWALIGIFRFDLVAFIFGDMSWISRIVYVIVGLCGIYLFSFYMRLSRDTANR